MRRDYEKLQFSVVVVAIGNRGAGWFDVAERAGVEAAWSDRGGFDKTGPGGSLSGSGLDASACECNLRDLTAQFRSQRRTELETFVLTQYFGYLRRNPDLGGINFWYGQVLTGPRLAIPAIKP